MSDFDLKALLDGDPRSMRAFILEYSPLFHKIVQSILFGKTWGNRQEDLVQDVFLALFEDEKVPFRALRAWRPDGGAPLKTFLGRFARFRILDRLRSQSVGGKRTALVSPEELARMAEKSPTSLPDGDARVDCASLIQVAQQVLSESELQFFTHAFIEDRPIADLAKSMDTTEAAIHQRRSRVRRAVVEAFNRALLEKNRTGRQ